MGTPVSGSLGDDSDLKSLFRVGNETGIGENGEDIPSEEFVLNNFCRLALAAWRKSTLAAILPHHFPSALCPPQMTETVDIYIGSVFSASQSTSGLWYVKKV